MESQEYSSSIPNNSREQIVERYPNGNTKQAKYLIDDQIVGVRSFHETGEPEQETPLQNGKKHGIEYTCYSPGVLTLAEPYVDGLIHGTAKQTNILFSIPVNPQITYRVPIPIKMTTEPIYL